MKKRILAFYTAISIFLLQAQTAFASNAIAESQLGKGGLALLNDAMKLLLVAAPVTGGICVAVFAIRKGMGDEADHKMWQKRINVALISTVIAVCASGLITLITGYFTGAKA
ncbi:MAG TPA: hypothetical protein DCP97_04865 [Ruminococcaceae bacterium]|jgi:hypothetical protein|nr:hypothetical protein [Oscillospiraceae bacterium]